jgi:hypothetical protein
LLTDKEATHHNIIDQFRSHLTYNSDINKGDPILFYFAGHGCRYNANESWPTDDGCQEAICPVDRGTNHPNGLKVPDISDRDLGLLLLELSRKKGDNITVILDCCFGGSATRQMIEGDMPVRRAEPIEGAVFETASLAAEIPPDSAQTRGLSDNRNHPNSSTHVLLAACRQHEIARESPKLKSGLFTHHLLTVLRANDYRNMTYMSLMDEVAESLGRTELRDRLTPSQHPQCEGKNKYRVLFDSRDRDNHLVPLFKEKDDLFTVEAGEIHGVVNGTIFTVQPHQLQPSHSAFVTATHVYTTWSVVKPLSAGFDIPAGRFARVHYWANHNAPFTIGFRNQPRISALDHQVRATLIQQNEERPSDVHIVHDETSPQVRIAVHERGVTFERKDELVRASDSDPIFDWKLVGNNDHLSIISNVARFNMHLYHENPAHPYRNQVSLSLFTLKGNNPQSHNHISNGIANLPSSEEYYVFSINNLSYKHLWCSLHYFDPSDYTITNMYTPPSVNMAPPLRKRSFLVIGHGSAGVPPFTFTVRPNELHDAGFVKLFISEHHADLTMIDQKVVVKEANTVRHTRDRSQDHGKWDSITVVIDVRRT